MSYTAINKVIKQCTNEYFFIPNSVDFFKVIIALKLFFDSDKTKDILYCNNIFFS
jgi:hypothetical protein